MFPSAPVACLSSFFTLLDTGVVRRGAKVTLFCRDCDAAQEQRAGILIPSGRLLYQGCGAAGIKVFARRCTGGGYEMFFFSFKIPAFIMCVDRLCLRCIYVECAVTRRQQKGDFFFFDEIAYSLVRDFEVWTVARKNSATAIRVWKLSLKRNFVLRTGVP